MLDCKRGGPECRNDADGTAYFLALWASTKVLIACLQPGAPTAR